MSEEWLERQEGPEGQWCDLLKRVPYDRQRMIEVGMRGGRSGADTMDAVLTGMLWECKVKDALTGEMTTDIQRAGAEIVQPWRTRAVELYNAWYAEAMPGPKGSPRTGSRTPRSGKKTPASATSERG